ncbi:hypothetical protein ACKWTF_000941 [Chironomus riparius]
MEVKNSDDFEFKYIPKSSFERVIRRIEDNKKSTNKDGMWGNFYSVSSEHDNSEKVKACYDIEPRQRDMRFNDVYNVLKSDKPMLPSEAAPLFGPSKKLNDVNDNQPSIRNQTTQQVISTKLKHLQRYKSEENSSNPSIHIVEVVNVADVRASDRSSKIQVTEQITPNDNVNDEKSGIIECSSDNDETLYSEILDFCNEIEFLNENDGSSVSHHGNEMKKKYSSAKSDGVETENKKAKNISEKLICEPLKTTYIDDELDFLDDDDEAVREFMERQKKGGSGLRTEYCDLRPETPFDYPALNNDKIKTAAPKENHHSQVLKTEHPQKKPERLQKGQKRVERLERPPSRHHARSKSQEELIRQRSKLPTAEECRPTSKESIMSLENLATQVVKKVSDYQDRICKYLSRIYDIICEPHETDDIHDFKTRQRRSVEFTNLFVRNHLYQIGRLAENIRVMNGNPIDIVTKVNSLFHLILQGVQSYLKNLEGFIYNNSPDKLLVLTEYIVNAIKVCFERQACSIRDNGIMEILGVIDNIRYCLKNCDKRGNLLPEFYEEMEYKKQQNEMQIGDFEGQLDEKQHNFEYSHSLVDEQGDGHKNQRLKSGSDHHGILKESRVNSRFRNESVPSEKFRTFNNENQHKKLRTLKENSLNDYQFPTEKIWNNEAEQMMIRSRGSSDQLSQMKVIQKRPAINRKPKSVSRNNISGYAAKSPYDMPSNPYGIPKMRTKPRVGVNRSNLISSKSNAHGSRLNSSKSSVHNGLHHDRRMSNGSSGLHPTKSRVHGLTNNSNLQSAKSTVYEIKKSSSDVSTVLQKEMEKGRLSAIDEEDNDFDQQSECGSKKSSKLGSEKKLKVDFEDHSRCSSRNSMKSLQKDCLKSQNDDRKIDSTKPEINNLLSKFIDMFQNPNDPDELMRLIQNMTKEKFESVMNPMILQPASSTDAKTEDIKKSVRRVKADVEPLKQLVSANKQHSMVERLAPNVQYMFVKNDKDDDSDEEEVEMPKAKESTASPKPSSMTKKSEDKKLLKSDSSEVSEDIDDGMDFSKFTQDELREMAIKERLRRHERIQNHPLYFNEQIAEPWTLFGQISDQILDELLEKAIKDLLTGSDVTEKELMEKFIKSELTC